MIPKNQESEQVFGFFKVITTYTFIYILYFCVLYTKWSNLKEHYRRLQWWLLLQIRNNTLVLCRARKHTIAEITFTHTHKQAHTHTCIYTHTNWSYSKCISFWFRMHGSLSIQSGSHVAFQLIYLFRSVPKHTIPFAYLILLRLWIFVEYVVFINATMHYCWITIDNRCARSRWTSERARERKRECMYKSTYIAAITTNNMHTVDKTWTRFNPIENYIIGKCDYGKFFGQMETFPRAFFTWFVYFSQSYICDGKNSLRCLLDNSSKHQTNT